MATISHVRADGPTSGRALPGDDALLWAAAIFGLVVLGHGADHVRRGVDSVSSDVFWVGTSAIALEVALVVLGVQRHRLAPLAALVGGASLAVGYVAVHFLPGRSWLSDSFTSAVDVSPLSWSAATLEVLAATTLAIVGLVVLRARGGLVSATQDHPTQRPLRAALLHPVSVGMIVGNLLVLGMSFADLL